MTTITIPDDHPIEARSQEDRRWFDDHPDRVFRVRLAADGDPGGAGSGRMFLVFCLTDDLRLRLPFSMTHPARLAHALELAANDGTDAELSRIFASVLAHHGRSRVTKGIWDCYERCRMLQRRLTREEFNADSAGRRERG
jgi:hypothetical protein